MNNSDKVYQELLKKSLKTIEVQIANLEKKNKGLRALTDYTTIEINGLKNQYREIKEALLKYESRITLSNISEVSLNLFDKKSAKLENKVKKHIIKITQLEAMKKNLHTTKNVRRINKQIKYQQEIIKNLQKQNNRISKIQKNIMLPKYYKIKKRNKLLNKQQAKVELMANNLKDIDLLKNNLNKESIIYGLKSVIYDVKGIYYQKKLSHSKAVLETMQKHDSPILIRGAGAITISKIAVNKLRAKNRLKKESAIDLLDASDDKKQNMNTVNSNNIIKH